MTGFFDTHPLHLGPSPDAEPAVPAGASPALAALLARASGRTYARGFWAFLPPARLARWMAPWDLHASTCLPFLKGGFGQIVFLQGADCKVLNPVFNTIDVLGAADDLGFVMDILLCDRPSLESSFLIDLYEAVWPRLGDPGDDEIYALVPALRLGGPRDAAHVQLRPMASEMPLLAQI
jgi:hypothetical protein